MRANNHSSSEDIQPNREKSKINNYPYVAREVPGGIVAYFDAETMEPLCFIPDKYTAWAGQFYVAFMVKCLSDQGGKPAHVRRQTEQLARAYRTEHLRKRVFIKTLRGQLRKAMVFQSRGQNTWATDYDVVEKDGRLIMVRFLPKPRK